MRQVNMSRRKNSEPLQLRIAKLQGRYAIVAAVAGALVAGIIGFIVYEFTHDSPSSSTTANASGNTAPTTPRYSQVGSPVPRASGLYVDSNVPLDGSTFCGWQLGTNPIPLASLNPPQVRIDDRCNFPQHPDPKSDNPTKIYQAATRESTVLASIPDGTTVTLVCYTHGQTTSDAVSNTSDLWLDVRLGGGVTGDMPDVNIGGGYTEQQLKALGLKPCT